MDYLVGKADAGVDIRLLTNALEATDVPAVHGGYAPYRQRLLEHGGLTRGEIATITGWRMPTVNATIAQLEETGVIVAIRRRRMSVYLVAP